MIMYVDVKEYAQAKLRCRLSGRASVLADYIVCQKEGFLFRMSVTMLLERNIIEISRLGTMGQKIDFNFDFNTWRFVQCVIYPNY